MKTLLFLISFLIGFSFLSCKDKDDDKILPDAEIPAVIKTYVSTHFPNNKILKVKEDGTGNNKKYEVDLDQNIELEFNSNLAIISIESTKQLPDSVIPAKILTYVKTNYASNFITDWELKNNQQKVELNNGKDLVFNLEGDFVRVD